MKILTTGAVKKKRKEEERTCFCIITRPRDRFLYLTSFKRPAGVNRRVDRPRSDNPAVSECNVPLAFSL